MDGHALANPTWVDTCCFALSTLLGNKVSFPDSEAYDASITSYFAQQNSELRPHCIVTPTSAEDVSTIINKIVSIPLQEGQDESECPFAVRSGGHTSLIGGPNINDGVTIDLSALDSISLSGDGSTLSIGPGASWGNVYAFLDPLGLSVAGGRVAPVGVGGLTLGGGMSYLSPRYGFTCDTVRAFEVVLANGTIVTVTDDEHADLMAALRGGASNLGVVTRIDFRVVEQGPVWGGNVIYVLETETVENHFQALVELNTAEGYDEFASVIMSLTFPGALGVAVVADNIVYTKAQENPETLTGFFETPALNSTMRITGIHEIATEMGALPPDGRRQLSVVTTQKSNLPLLKATYHHWDSTLSAVQDIGGIVWSLSFQPLPPSIYARAATANALGFSDKTEPLFMVLLSATWDDENDDTRVEEAARTLFATLEDEARRLDSYDPFLYLNYAAEWQDPIASYGAESVEMLRRVAEEVDPDGVFRVRMPGGFKIPV
ncbi:putative oxidoreductase [Aspergillus egyptiacus]|nr:putative oxidoreductase [Aspergillus egyptiacus]